MDSTNLSLALLHTVSLAIVVCLHFKIARDSDSSFWAYSATFAIVTTLSALAMLAVFGRGTEIPNGTTLWIAPLLCGLFASINAFFKNEAGRNLPVKIAVALSRLNYPLVVIASVVALNESEDLPKVIPIFLLVGAVVWAEASTKSQSSNANKPRFAYGLAIGVSSAMISATVQTTSKLFLDNDFGYGVDKFWFLLLTATSNMILTTAAFVINGPRNTAKKVTESMALGAFAGAINCVAMVSLYTFLSTGNASTIFGLSTIAMAAPAVLYTKREKAQGKVLAWLSLLLLLMYLIWLRN